jgi:hypothetical protein
MSDLGGKITPRGEEPQADSTVGDPLDLLRPMPQRGGRLNILDMIKAKSGPL